MTDPSHPVSDPSGNADRVTEAYHQIRRLILFRRLSAGTPIIQARMAEDLGHSRATLRAALQRLVREGYMVETALGTYSRFVVASLTVEDMRDLFFVVGALEGVAIREVAALPLEDREELAKQMELFNERALAFVTASEIDPEQANQWDTEFHIAFTSRSTGSRVLSQLQSIRPQVDRYRDLYVNRVAGEARILASPEHQAIVEAIRVGDPDVAERAVVRHWRSGSVRLAELIRKVGERRGYGED